MEGKLTMKSKLSCYLLVIFHLLFLVTFVVGSDYKCVPTECGCKCTNSTRTYEMSLKGIGRPDDPLEPPSGTSWTYSVSTCPTFTVEGTDCKDVVMCQTSSDKKDHIPIGRKIQECSKVSESEPMKVSYYPLTYRTTAKRQLIINVGCAKKTSAPTKVEEDTTKLTFTFGINTPYGCLHNATSPSGSSSGGGGGGVSTGSVIVITFFVILVIYLVAGILFMKYKRGATGKEVIPNIEFWSSLPGLIKDGCVFFGKKMKELCGRCCNREGYNEI